MEVNTEALPPIDVATLHDEFTSSTSPLPEHSNFLKGVKFSPDGVGFLTAADDNSLRVYDLPQSVLAPPDPESAQQPSLQPPQDPFWPALRIPAGELIYDYAWYPCASAAEPETYCFAVTSRSHPIHLYDACTGHLRCSYRPYNALDELSPAYSVGFSRDGERLFAGCKSAIQIFDVERPGRDHITLSTFSKKQDGQPGIISCLAFAPDNPSLMATGAYSGVAALYDPRTREQLAVLEGHSGGVTHLRFSACGGYLYTGARRDGGIFCWDARYLSGAVYSMRRETTTTNQRIYFDVEPSGRHLASGGEDGWVMLWDLRDGSEAGKFRAAGDTVNGCEFHPSMPLLATASGQRRFLAVGGDSEDSGSEKEEEMLDAGGKKGQSGGFSMGQDENALRLWRLGMRAVDIAPMEAAEEGILAAGG